MMAKRNRRREHQGFERKFGFENLEDRSMLSITAFLAGTQLEVFGTSANESVQITQSGNKWKVQGLGTKVNGSSSAQSFSGVTDIFTDLGKGTDLVQILNGTLSGGVTVFYQPGESGTKTSQLINLKVGSAQVINEDNGINTITATNLQTTSGGAGFFTGNANDVISLANLTLTGNLEVSAGNGNNTIAVANTKTGGYSTDVIESGNGRDSIAISQYSSVNNLDVTSGDGTDTVTLSSVKIGSANLYVDVGAGNQDVLTVVNSTAGLTELLDNGGTNGILTGSGNHFATLIISPNFTHRSGF